MRPVVGSAWNPERSGGFIRPSQSEMIFAPMTKRFDPTSFRYDGSVRPLVRPMVSQNHRSLTVASATALLFIAGIMLIFNPVGYAGGLWDDGRYLERALRWVEEGPYLGSDHWALRWPVLVDPILSLGFWGLDREALMLFPLIGWLLTGALLFAMMLRRWGHAAAVTATLAFIVTPELLTGATRIGADVRELLFWSASFWCFALAVEKPGRRWPLLAAGVFAALAFAVRETGASILLLYGLAFLHGRLLPRSHYLWIAAGFLPPFLVEHALLFAASGDPLYRFHIDMNHVTVPTYMMDGMVAKGGNPLSRFDIAASWLHPGPVAVWWPVNPFLNLFFRSEYGLLFWVVGAALVAAKAMRLGRPEEWRIAWMLLAAATIQMAFNIFVLVTDPQPRMFLPAIYCACILLGLVARWLAEGGRLALAMPLFPLLLGGGLWGIDKIDNFAGVEQAGAMLLSRAEGPVHIDGYSRSHLTLILPPESQRLRPGPPPVGGLALTVQRPMWPLDTINGHLFALPSGQCWQQVHALRVGRIRTLFAFDIARNYDVDANRLVPPYKVALYRRMAGASCSGH